MKNEDIEKDEIEETEEKEEPIIDEEIDDESTKSDDDDEETGMDIKKLLIILVKAFIIFIVILLILKGIVGIIRKTKKTENKIKEQVETVKEEKTKEKQEKKEQEEQEKAEKYTYTDLENRIEIGAQRYQNDNYSGDSESFETMVLTYEVLKEKGYMSSRLLDPTSKKECNGYVKFIKREVKITYEPYIKCGSNYQTTDFDASYLK